MEKRAQMLMSLGLRVVAGGRGGERPKGERRRVSKVDGGRQGCGEEREGKRA